MAPVLVFLLTLAQALIIGAAKFFGAGKVLATLLIHGSPVGLLQRMLTHDSPFYDGSIIYILLILFHLWKYFLFYRAQLFENGFALLYGAIALEAGYLAYSAYILI